MVKFLIIRFSSIGDIILTTPIVRCMKLQIKDAEIHFLTKSKYSSILESNPYIAKIHTLDKSFSKLIKELNNECFDYIIDLHRNLRTLRVKVALHRYSFTFNKINVEKWLIVNLKINKLPKLHIVDRYFQAVTTFSVNNDQKGLDYFIPKADEVNIKEFTKNTDYPYLLIIVGGGHFTKQIPANKIVDIIQGIDYPVILAGGPEDMVKAQEIENLSTITLVNLAGKLNLNQSASLIRQSMLILTPDTGMMHIAAAFKKKIFSIWGNTVPEFGMYPYLPGPGSEIFEVHGLSCRPCSKIGFKKCPKGHFNCMNQQDYTILKAKLNAALSETIGNN